MAGLLDAIIVPFSAVGISDSVTILLDQTGTVCIMLYSAFVVYYLFLVAYITNYTIESNTTTLTKIFLTTNFFLSFYLIFLQIFEEFRLSWNDSHLPPLS